MRLHTIAVALAAALATCACRQQAPSAAETDPAVPAAATAAQATQVRAMPRQDLSRRSTADLADAADRALREGRLYAPAGDSAIEYWLEARSRDPDDAAVASVVVELQPYLLIGCEEAIARHDFDEARRLHRLIAASDANAPALQRLATAIAVAEADARRQDAARLAAEEAQRQRADSDVRASAMTQARAAPPAAPVVAASGQPVPQPQRSEPAPAQPIVAQASVAEDAPGAAGLASAAQLLPGTHAARAGAAGRVPVEVPRALHQPPPRYPSLALSRRMEGAVRVAFTIRTDGAVQDTRVVSATPPGVFDRSALAAVADYRFEPVEEAMASTVTVRFALAK